MRRFMRCFPSVEAMVVALRPTEPVYCYYPHHLKQRVNLFLEKFPGDVLFAVKCNPDPGILQEIYSAGIGHFDTASLQEISQVKQWLPESECHFMHPVKPRSVITAAHSQYAIIDYVVDSRDEVDKLYQQLPTSENFRLFVRLETLDFGAAYKLSGKFGATVMESAELLQYCHQLGFKIGLSFHVGSQCPSLQAYESALERVEAVIQQSQLVPQALDIGGGFPAPYANSDVSDLPICLDYVRDLLIRIGHKYPGMRFLCEPGRAIVSSAMSLVTQVQLRKQGKLYLNDGIYGNLSESITGNVQFPIRWIGSYPPGLQEYTLYGPTCDSLDVLSHSYQLPVNINEGDFIIFDEIGAYSNANTTSFNGFITENWVTVSDYTAMYLPAQGLQLEGRHQKSG